MSVNSTLMNKSNNCKTQIVVSRNGAVRKLGIGCGCTH